MKAKNYKEVTRGYLIFTLGMVVLIIFFLIISSCFISTTRIEHNKIMAKAVIFDQTHSKQIDVVNRVDSLYNYMSLINSNERVNNVILQGAVSSRKMQLLDYISTMSVSDVLLYNQLIEQMNTFLNIKEDIRSLTVQEQFIKSDLQRCINDNKQANRRLIIGGSMKNK